MQHVGEWLESIGMPEYGEAFADNKIDIAVLPHLTDQDLKDLGIPLGHRRKMLASIAGLGGPTRAARHHAFTIQADVQDVPERRHVTVMFSDLVGSTALSSSMDPEDLRDLISAYQTCVADIVERFDGFVAKFLGDGVVVFFGYPQAQEDDAERAVRAGLELVAGVTALKSRVVLQSRVGIATGLVVVGDLLASGDAYERDVVGETPNFAARLQAIAEPNTVVICDNTRKLLGHLFELEELGPRTLKGIARPTRAWTAMRPSLVASRFEALRATGLTALVGRDEERELLLRRWARAKSGEGQVVLLSGEAGIGKSRLTADLLEKLAPERHVRLRYFCSPQHTNSAFYPIIVQMERAARLEHSDTPAVALAKLEALLAQTATPTEDKALIAELLSLQNDGRYPDLDLSPEQRRQGILDALALQLRLETRSSPVLIMFEDAHWSDPTTMEALSRTVDQIAGLRALL